MKSAALQTSRPKPRPSPAKKDRAEQKAMQPPRRAEVPAYLRERFGASGRTEQGQGGVATDARGQLSGEPRSEAIAPSATGAAGSAAGATGLETKDSATDAPEVQPATTTGPSAAGAATVTRSSVPTPPPAPAGAEQVAAAAAITGPNETSPPATGADGDVEPAQQEATEEAQQALTEQTPDQKGEQSEQGDAKDQTKKAEGEGAAKGVAGVTSGQPGEGEGEAAEGEGKEGAAGEGAAAKTAAVPEQEGEGGGSGPSVEQGGDAEGGGESEGEAEMEERLAAVSDDGDAEEDEDADAESEPPGAETESERAARSLLPPSATPGEETTPVDSPEGEPAALTEAEREVDDSVAEERAAEDAQEQLERSPPAGLGGGDAELADVPAEPDAAPADYGGAGAEQAASDGSLTSAQQGVVLSSLGESAGGGGGGMGGGGGGGAIEDEPVPEPPDLSGADPLAAMGTLAGMEPAAAVQAMGGVGAAVGTSVGDERKALAESPPEVPRSYGLNPTDRSAAATARQASTEKGPEKVKQAPEGAALPVPAPEPLPTPPPPPTQGLAEPKVQGGEGGEMSDSDVKELKGSVHSLPVTDKALHAKVGDAPKLDMQGDSDPARMQDQQAELDATMAQARARGSKDAATPMGEDNILPKRRGSGETLKATIPGGGGSAAAGGGGGELPSEAAGIIAKEQSGAELAAAARQAQSDMATKRGEHRTRMADERSKSAAEVAALETTAAADQTAEQRAAQGKVSGMHGEWSAAQQAVVDKRGGEARTAMTEGDKQVLDQRTQGEASAVGHIETGEGEVAAARNKGETEAAAQKAKAEEKSSGFLGWLASKAKAFFDGIKKGIQKAFAAARAAVKAAIDKAKKLALAAIEKARSAIVAAIKKVGAALIAIGDKLLADFPGLRDRFRGAIEGAVSAAEAAVNKIADGLKKGVQMALDAFGGALDAALGLLEKGLLAVVDVYSAVVTGALKAARAVADALGMFAVLIKDIAAGPARWIGNLGAGIMDGLKNHLWPALKAAFKNWFNQKLEEVLGLGTALWGVLTKGGISLAKIGAMAWEALKAAIPPTLIQLLIEKLMSMIVPAAGAVLAVIEGMQAAWGTVQRVIAAMAAFMAFLKSVKPGTAGPPFAKALAAGAVVVIDFVANWLLRRLRKPAGKVAGKLKAAGKKILAKLKKAAKKVGRKLKAAARKIGRKLKAAGRKIKKKFSRKKKGAKGKSKPKKKTKEQKKQERLDKAGRELPPKINALLAKGVSKMGMRARLVYWRARYRLSRLEIIGSGCGVSIRATVNPSLDLITQLLIKEGPALFKMIRVIGRAMLNRPDVQAAMQRIVDQRAEGKGKTADDPIRPEGPLGESADIANFPSGKAAKDTSELAPGTSRPKGSREHIEQPGGVVSENQTYSPAAGHIKTAFEGHGGSYEEIRAELDALKSATGKSDADLAKALITAQQTGKIPPGFEKFTNFKSLSRLAKVEMGRSSAQVVTGTLGMEMMAEGNLNTGQVFGDESNTMVKKGAVATASQASADSGLGAEQEYAAKRSASKVEVQRMLDTELELMSRYIFSKLNIDKPLVRNAAQLETLIKKELRDYIQDMVEKGIFGVGGGIL